MISQEDQTLFDLRVIGLLKKLIQFLDQRLHRARQGMDNLESISVLLPVGRPVVVCFESALILSDDYIVGICLSSVPFFSLSF